MNNRRQWNILATAFLACVLQGVGALGPAAAQTPAASTAAETPPAAEPMAGEPEASVDVSVSPSGRLMAPVMIGQSGPHSFIVDTAAERSVIASDLADLLQLEPAGRSGLLSVTSTRSVERVNIPDFSFPEGRRMSLRAFEFDRKNIGAAGVLGIDALRGQKVVLDFRTKTVRISTPASRPERPAPNEIVVYGKRRFGQLILADADVDGQHVDVIVDSGLSASLGNEALRRLLVTRAQKFTPVQLVSITGESLQADFTQVDRLRLGGVAITGMPIAFADAYFFQRLRLTSKPTLLLGVDTLQYFDRVTVDFPNRRAQFVLPQSPRS